MMRNIVLPFVVIISLIGISGEVFAGKKKKPQSVILAPIPTSLVVDTKTGKVLHAENAKERIYPASLTKLMTLYMMFEAIDSGKLSMNKRLYVSKKAERIPPTKLYLKAGEYISVKDAILALIVKSANDVAIAVAEDMAGSEEAFARRMTIKAFQLGMRDTNFTNSHGLHHNAQKATAIDLAKLSIALKRDFPRFYPLFAKNSFEFRGKKVNGHNRVTANYKYAEGLKTGFTTPSGFNLVTTASRGNKSLVGVVTGGKSASQRDQKMVKLLDKHFGVESKQIKTKKLSPKIVSNYKKKKYAAGG